jgi:hypothetical protein
MVGFIFGSKDKDKPWSYEELQRKREIAETLAAGNLRTPQNVGEGLASIGRALMYRKLDKRAGAEESRMRDEFNAKWGSVFGGYGGGAPGMAASGGGGRAPSGTWTPEAPGPKPTETHMGMPDVAKGGLSFGDMPKADTGVARGGNDFGAAVMTPQEMLIAGAERRGLDPIDVATAISYETGGKFDPTIKGPTTQWGTHEGLIQFGDPQGEKYGADFSSPEAAWRSQLNPETGAVWGYLEDTGVKPGMGLPEIYSAINAGGVGRMGASDANNGGAPGTVADKVASMGPHRDKAAAFLGGTWTPNPDAGAGGGNVTMSAKGPAPAMGMDIGALVGLASDPMASPAQKAIIETLIQQQLQAADPLRAMQMEKAQLELEALRNPAGKQTDFDLRAAEAVQYGMEPGTPEYQQFVLTGDMPKGAGADAATYGTTLQFFTGEDGKLRAGVLGNDGTMKEIEPPGGGDWAQGVDKVDAGTKWLFYDKRTGEMVGEQPKDLRGAESEKAIGKAEGEAVGAASTGLGAAESQAAEGVALIQSIIDDPALPSITGMIQGRLPPLSQAGTDLNEKIKQVKGKAFLEAFESLKGGGAISEREGEAATQAIARLERAQSDEAYIEALTELQGILQTGLANMKAKAGAATPAALDLGLSEDDLKYLE